MPWNGEWFAPSEWARQRPGRGAGHQKRDRAKAKAARRARRVGRK